MNADKYGKDSGRKKIFFVPYRFLIGFFNGALENYSCIQLPRPLGLPKDYHVVAVHEDFMRHAFAVVIESSEFPETEIGEMFPVIDVEWDTVQVAKATPAISPECLARLMGRVPRKQKAR